MKPGEKYKLKNKLIIGLNRVSGRPQLYIKLIKYLNQDLWQVMKYMEDGTKAEHVYSGDYIYSYYEKIEEA